MKSESSNAPDPKKPWFDPVTAILMGIVSLSTAWCSYQSSEWGSRSSSLASNADKLERLAISQHLEARQIEAIQMRLWMEAMDAQIDRDDKLARFYIDRFDNELKPAYEKWVALKPFENPNAPHSPFVPDLYHSRFEDKIKEENEEAARAEDGSRIAGEFANGYLSNTVIFATVLFFAGTAGRFDRRSVRWSSLAFAIALFLYAAVRMLLLPVI